MPVVPGWIDDVQLTVMSGGGVIVGSNVRGRIDGRPSPEAGHWMGRNAWSGAEKPRANPGTAEATSSKPTAKVKRFMVDMIGKN